MALPAAAFGFSKTYHHGADFFQQATRPGTGTGGGGRRRWHRRRRRLTQPFPGQQCSGVFLSMVPPEPLEPSDQDDNEGRNDDSSIDDEIRNTVLAVREETQTRPQPPAPAPPDSKTISIEERFNQLLDSVDEFLDTPFFDPDQYLDENEMSKTSTNKKKTGDDANEEGDSKDDGGIVTKFARLVKEDYELAETLFVGTFFVVLIIGTQELLRMQLYGDSYVPFMRHPSAGGWNGGKLF